MLDAAEHKKLVRVCDLVVLVLQSPNDPEKDPTHDHRDRREVPRRPAAGNQPPPGNEEGEPYENTRQTAERILKEGVHEDRPKERQSRPPEDRARGGGNRVSVVPRRHVRVPQGEIVEGTISISDPDLLKKVGLPTYSNWEATDDVGNLKYFKWMTAKQAEEKKVKLTPEKQEVSTLVKAPIGLSEEALKQQLTKAGIDVSKYGIFASCKSERRHDNRYQLQFLCLPVGVADCQYGYLIAVLVQTKQADPHGKETILNRLPGDWGEDSLSRRQTGGGPTADSEDGRRRHRSPCGKQNQFLSARRIIRRQLEMDENQVVFDENVKHVEEDKASNTYPGLKTVYRKRIISASWSSTGS
ncbi:unnamed protein product [Prorocentrum cordatum]|uniref:Uncharacterized protein n=1 Tax=Prorocentrum cordatum TaxID=2364126 RepID=A0ABN9U3G2_9DINO|nr:unnamed protein product [Polarella glacialis]